MKPLFLMFVGVLCLRAQENPIASLSFGYIYLNADSHTGGRASYNGWYAIPQCHINNSWSAIAEFTNYYGSPHGMSENIHAYTFGPLYSIDTKTKITPFVFGEIGDVRTSAPGPQISNAFAFVAGAGANVKLMNRVSLQIIPGDYILAKPSAGPLHHYAAQVGMAFDFGSK